MLFKMHNHGILLHYFTISKQPYVQVNEAWPITVPSANKIGLYTSLREVL